MKGKYLKQHRNFMENLSSNRAIIVQRDNYTLADAKLEMTQNFPREMVNFYNEFESVSLAWKANPEWSIDYLDEELDFVEGEFNLVERSQFYKGINALELQKNYGLKINEEQAQWLHPFDELLHEYIVCIDKNNHERLFFLDLDQNQIHEISIDFPTYLSLGYRNYFFYGWQKAILLHSTNHIKKLKHYLHQLFSNYKFNEHTL